MARRGCRRRLDTAELAEDFVTKTFGKGNNVEKIAKEVLRAEMELVYLEKKPTKLYTEYRAKRFRDDMDREVLYDQILSELINYEQLDSDDDICLGQGGAKPKEPRQERIAYIVSGSPASGKSSIADNLARNNAAHMVEGLRLCMKNPTP